MQYFAFFSLLLQQCFHLQSFLIFRLQLLIVDQDLLHFHVAFKHLAGLGAQLVSDESKMVLQMTQSLILAYIILEFLKLKIPIVKLPLQLIDPLSHLRHFGRHDVWCFLDDLIDTRNLLYGFRLLSKIESLLRFVLIGFELVQSTDDGSLCISLK